MPSLQRSGSKSLIFSYSQTTTAMELGFGTVWGFLPSWGFIYPNNWMHPCVIGHVNRSIWCGRSCWVNAQDTLGQNSRQMGRSAASVPQKPQLSWDWRVSRMLQCLTGRKDKRVREKEAESERENDLIYIVKGEDSLEDDEWTKVQNKACNNINVATF